MKKQVLCKSCGCIFVLTEKQIKYYSDREWQLPKHCVMCRETKRQEREKEEIYYGLEEAFANYMPLKKRRQRVHYSPYIVGGMR